MVSSLPPCLLAFAALLAGGTHSIALFEPLFVAVCGIYANSVTLKPYKPIFLKPLNFRNSFSPDTLCHFKLPSFMKCTLDLVSTMLLNTRSKTVLAVLPSASILKLVRPSILLLTSLHSISHQLSLSSNLYARFIGEWCVDKGKMVFQKFNSNTPAQTQAGASSSAPNVMDGFAAPTNRDKNKWGF